MGFRKETVISDETIIGYILSSLPEGEMSFIEDQLLLESLTGKSVLAQRLIDLRELLRPIEIAHTEQFEPSSDLVDRTLSLVQAESPIGDVAGVAGREGTTGGESSTKRSSSVLMPTSSAARGRPFAWLDGVATIAVCLVAICLVLPGIWNAREQARKISCAEKLRSLGLAMHSFADMRSDGEFPKVDPNGALAFAGVYAIRLKDAHLIESVDRVWCPSSSFARTLAHLPTMEVYCQSPLDQQQAWRRTVGGTYAYNLGYVSDGNYQTPSVREAYRKPLLGDYVVMREQSAGNLRGVHNLESANIVFTDGQVATVRIVDLCETTDIDHPYFNDALQREAGVGIHDACLAPSFVSPFKQSVYQVSQPASR